MIESLNSLVGVDDAAEKVGDKVDRKIHEVYKEAGNGVGEGDKKQGDDEVWEGVLDRDDGLGVYLGSKHDHEANDDKDDDIDGVGKVSEDFPEGYGEA